MASILTFIRRAAPAAAATDTAALARMMQDCSIEVMPRTAAKIDDFRALLPAGTRVYVAHIDGTPFADVLATARRLMRQNLILTVVYNGVAVPLAIAGTVTPLIAALAIIRVFSAQTLLRPSLRRSFCTARKRASRSLPDGRSSTRCAGKIRAA